MWCRLPPGNPADLDPPLGDRVKRWWPSVLGALGRVRTRPRWYLLDVYCDRLDAMPAAEAAFVFVEVVFFQLLLLLLPLPLVAPLEADA